jgi:type IV pilus biogenesis protein CpaD/CtpE
MSISSMRNHSCRALALTALLGLTACGGLPPQTPLQFQEPLVKPDFQASYAEDRITLRFAPGQSQLDMGQKDYIKRFVEHYKGSKHTAVFVSLLLPPEAEDIGNLPRHRPDILMAYQNVGAEVHGLGIRPRMLKEVDTFGQPHVTEARARKAMVDTAAGGNNPGDIDTSYLTPDPANLQRETKIAVIAREYEVQAGNCPQQGHWQWEGMKYASTGISTGCSVHQNMLSQIKDHSVLVQGEEMDPEYYSAFPVKQLRKVQDAEYDSVFQTAKSGTSGGFKGGN